MVTRPATEFQEQKPGLDIARIAQAVWELSSYPIERAFREQKTVTAAYVMDPVDDRTIFANGTFAVSLPDATEADYVAYTVVNIGAGTVTVDTVGGDINGAASVALAATESVTVESDDNDYFRTDL